MSSRHGGVQVVLLPRDTEGKSADVEAFTHFAAARLSVTHSTNFFLLSTSNPVAGQCVTSKVMAYTLRTFRGYQNVSPYKDALSGAYNQVEAIKADGFGGSFQWVRIEDMIGMWKLVFRRIDGSIGETPWMSNY